MPQAFSDACYRTGLQLCKNFDTPMFVLTNNVSYGGVNVMIPACFLSAVMAFILRAVFNEAGLIAVSSLYGFISGGMVSLPPAMIANLTINTEEYGTRIGVGYTIAAFGALIGNPIAGALQFGSKSSKQSVQELYQGTWFFAGSIMLLCTCY